MNNNENEGKMVNDKIEKAAKAEKSKTSREDSAAKGEKEAKPVKKKKRLIAVFHPQNASSKEGKSFHQVMDKDKKKKTREKTGRTDGAAGRVEGSRRGVMQESSRGGRPVGNRASAGTPIVKVPRPHPVIRTEEAPKPAPAETKKKSAVRNTPVTEAAKPEAAAATIGAETASAKPNAAESAKINSSAAEMAEKSSSAGTATEMKVSNGKNGAPQSEATAAEKSEHETASQERPAAGTASVAAGESSERQNQGTRNDADRSGGQSRNYGDRSGGQGRSYGDRNNGGQGRSFGDRNNGGQSRRPFGDRNNRPGFGGNRPGFGGNRPGFGGKDAEEGNRFPGHSRGQHSDHKGGQGAAMDMGLKKPSRDGAGHNKDKDKNKSDLRGNKYTSDRGNGRNNRHLIPKALQRPVHKKEEKKEEKVTEIKIPEKVTIRELAEKMKMQPSVIVKDLFMKGEMYTVNQEVDYEKAEEIAMAYDILCEPEEKVDVIAEMLKEDEEDESKMIPRPPVVCVMGHVDHGKTSLLDAIRHAHVTSKEAGGITQNIGAYVVNINNKKITFLDTPGHEAFTAMRLRGAQSTDIAVLVVAADDGVMPQTIEAINHAKAAGVEIIVAINKIDKPGANVDRVKQELTEYGLIASDWGGQTEMVEVSAKTGVGLDDLLETILLTADIMELKANPDRLARGLVLEAKLDKGKGPVANLLVQKGTLHVGDYIACGACSGKVRAMTDENGKRVKTAGPSTPVEVQGLDGVPDAGETLVAMETDKEAKNFAATFTAEHKNQLLEETKSRMSLDDLFSQIQDGSVKELELVIKADVQGSVEAIRQSLLKLSNDEVVVKIIHAGVGAINESDVTLAAASNAIVIGFNVRPDANAKALAEQEKVDVRLYKVIYQAIDDIEAAMKGMLEPIYEEKVIGHAEVRQLFKASGVGTIAGSYVLDGIVQRGCKVRISRGDKQIFEGDLASLKRFKDDVKEVKAGYECGLVFDGFNEVREGDQVEAYAMVEVPR
ncbi:MAG: translation initiation factor IF-2 [Eubacterium sp.]|nr:translation initiation factor IF-2 [Eubacterium sp.]